jgi:hypothetical protein
MDKIFSVFDNLVNEGVFVFLFTEQACSTTRLTAGQARRRALLFAVFSGSCPETKISAQP